MIELKRVVVLNDEIINVGEMADMPEGATLEEREMEYTLEYGWREVSWKPPISEVDKLRHQIEVQNQAIAELSYLILIGGM